jgi:glycosyltransferase involved in cell wall biosynthesis
MWKSVCNCIIKKKEFDIFIHSDFFFAYARLSILRQLLLFPAYLFTAIACRRCKYLFASSISRLPKSIREKAKFTPPVQGYCGCIEKRPVFVWVGRLNISTAWGDIKGIKKLIKIAKKHPEFKFIVYGSGNCSGLFKNLHNIELKGFVVNLFQELDPKTHILLATSKSEGFGRAVHEASCRGLTSYVTTGFPVEVTRLPKVIVYRDIEEELFFLNYLIEHGAEH